jgi:hypothetical protein
MCATMIRGLQPFNCLNTANDLASADLGCVECSDLVEGVVGSAVRAMMACVHCVPLSMRQAVASARRQQRRRTSD